MSILQVTLRRFLNDARLQRTAATRQKTLVTFRGKPYFLVLPADQPPGFVGRGRHLSTGKPTDGLVPKSEWKGLA